LGRVRPCRLGYARKSSFVFVRSSCLWFLPPSAVEKSRSAKARAGRQMGRWADRCRGIGHQLPTASEGPQAGRWRRAPQRLDSSTYRLQNRGNKARMSMKTNSREVENSRSRGAVKPDQEVRRGDAYGLSLFDFQLSTLNCLTLIRRNKARMSMKTKDKCKMSGSADRLFCGLRLFRARWGRAADRKHGGLRYTKIEGTRRECL